MRRLFFAACAANVLLLLLAYGPAFAGIRETNACKERSLKANGLTERSARTMRVGATYQIVASKHTLTYIFARGNTLWSYCEDAERIRSVSPALSALPTSGTVSLETRVSSLENKVAALESRLDAMQKAAQAAVMPLEPSSSFPRSVQILLILAACCVAALIAAGIMWFLFSRHEKKTPRFPLELEDLLEPKKGDSVEYLTNPARQNEGGEPHRIVAQIEQSREEERSGRKVVVYRGLPPWNGPYIDLVVYDPARMRRSILTAGIARTLARAVREQASGQPSEVASWLTSQGWRFKTEDECDEHILLDRAEIVPAARAAPVASTEVA